MKRIMINRLCMSLILTLFSASIFAQGIIVYKQDGTMVNYSYSEVDSIVTYSVGGVAVDLGLPSGTLWADRNIGADSPEGYGDYFAWGETSPKDVYNWDTYKWCNSTSSFSLTKYCTNSYYGTYDNKTVLDAEDDAATANWDSAWRMPTHEEQEELHEKCTWTWTTQNGIKGYKVVGPNGNSIFLPAAGCRSDSSVDRVGYSGHYWSASLDESNLYSAWNMYFSSSRHYTSSDSHRYPGYTVRAVAR